MKQLGTLMIGLLLISSCTGQIQDNQSSDQKVKPKEQKSLLLGPKAFQKSLLEDSNYYLIDVRTPREYQKGTIMDAQNIDFYNDDFQSKLNDLNKDKSVYLFCHSGNRSGKTAKLLQEKGFKNIIDLKGGIVNWKKVNP